MKGTHKHLGDNGLGAIVAERYRQIADEGWSQEHDDEHTEAQLAKAAACYASPVAVVTRNWDFDVAETDAAGNLLAWADLWPWAPGWDKRSARPVSSCNELWGPELIRRRMRELEKAGALCAAEWDRLARVLKTAEVVGRAR